MLFRSVRGQDERGLLSVYEVIVKWFHNRYKKKTTSCFQHIDMPAWGLLRTLPNMYLTPFCMFLYVTLFVINAIIEMKAFLLCPPQKCESSFVWCFFVYFALWNSFSNPTPWHCSGFVNRMKILIVVFNYYNPINK